MLEVSPVQGSSASHAYRTHTHTATETETETETAPATKTHACTRTHTSLPEYVSTRTVASAPSSASSTSRVRICTGVIGVCGESPPLIPAPRALTHVSPSRSVKTKPLPSKRNTHNQRRHSQHVSASTHPTYKRVNRSNI
eukprot:2747431-Rhodomonas_salina.1